MADKTPVKATFTGSNVTGLAEFQTSDTIAVTDASLASFALGTHEWLIENDNVECSNKGKPYTRVLKLTGCKDGEFTCRDGQCIRNLKALIILYKHGHVNIRN